MTSLQLAGDTDFAAGEIDAEDDPIALGAGPNIGRVVRIAFIVIAAFAAIFVIWGFVAPLSKAAIAPGVVQVEGRRRTVQHLEGGIVSEILVRENMRVRKGQPLMRLDTVQSGAAADAATSQYYSLLAEEKRLQAELSGQSLTFDDELKKAGDRASEIMDNQRALMETRRASLAGQADVLRTTWGQAQAEISSLEAQVSAHRAQLTLLRGELETVQQLVNEQLERRSRLLELQRAVASAEGQIGNLTGQILRARRDGGLYDYLLDQFATHSGLSGVQPKVMVRDNDGEQAHTLRTATHIVKFWNPGQFDELAANEFFCLSAARAAGLDVPDFRLADDGSSLVVKRFDIAADGTPLGFEDLCSLNGMLTAQKYNGGYEASVFRRLGDFVSPHLKAVSLEQAVRLLVLNVAIRNGDAHLKNWGVLYRDTESDVSLAPVYDLVTTTAYVPPDLMALTMNASQRWPEPRKLAQFGKLRTMLTMPQIQAVFERTADALAETAPELSRYFADSPNPEIGQAMLRGWSEGVEHSLGLVRGLVAGADLETVPGPAR